MRIAWYVGRRCVAGAVTVVVVSLVVFLLTHVLGDPAAALLGPTARQPEVLAATRAELGLDRPLAGQFLDWWGGLLTGDAGASYATGAPFAGDLLTRLGNSMVLVAMVACIAVPVSILAGTSAAARRDRWFDGAVNVSTLVLVAVPEFVVAVVLVVAFSTAGVGVLPATSDVRGFVRPWDDVAGMILPVTAMALLAIPYVTRSMRSSMADVLDTDYIATGRLNAVSPRRLVWQHALPNALPPTLQVISLSVAYLATGAVVVEAVFNYPGIGSALVQATRAHDVPVVQLAAVTIAALYVACNVAADVVTMLLTPRLRTSA